MLVDDIEELVRDPLEVDAEEELPLSPVDVYVTPPTRKKPSHSVERSLNLRGGLVTDHLLCGVARFGRTLPLPVTPELRQRIERDVLLLKAFHVFIDGAPDVVYVDVLIILSVTEQCGEIVVSTIALTEGVHTRNLATADTLQTLARTPGAISFFQSTNGFKRVGRSPSKQPTSPSLSCPSLAPSREYSEAELAHRDQSVAS